MDRELISVCRALATAAGPSTTGANSSTGESRNFSELLTGIQKTDKAITPASTDKNTVINAPASKMKSAVPDARELVEKILDNIPLNMKQKSDLSKILEGLKSDKPEKLNIAIPALLAFISKINTAEFSSAGETQYNGELQKLIASFKNNAAEASGGTPDRTNQSLTAEQTENTLKELLAKLSRANNKTTSSENKQNSTDPAPDASKKVKQVPTDTNVDNLQLKNEGSKSELAASKSKASASSSGNPAKTQRASSLQNDKIISYARLSSGNKEIQNSRNSQAKSDNQTGNPGRSTAKPEINNSTLQSLIDRSKTEQAKSGAQEMGKSGDGIAQQIKAGPGKQDASGSGMGNNLKNLNLARLVSEMSQTKQNAKTGSTGPGPTESVETASQQVQAPSTGLFAKALSAQGPKGTNNSSAGSTTANIGKQISDNIYTSLTQSSGDRQLSIRLHPPELGKVFIRFQQQQDQITGLLQVSKMQTHNEISQALPEIIRTLQQAGIQVKQLEVSLTDQQQQQPMFKDDSPGQNGVFNDGEQAGENPTQQENPENLQTGEPATAEINESQLVTADESLNLLI